MKPAVRRMLLGAPRLTANQMLTVVCGNSISTAGQYLNGGSAGWQFRSEVQQASALAGGCLRFGLTTATLRSDAYGCYGFSGATLDAINADIQSQWIAQVSAGMSPPDLVIGLSLVENDIAGGASVADMVSRLEGWIGTVRSAWPRAVILLCTPRVSFSYDTAAKVSAYQAMRDYMLARDNGRSIFAARCDAYESGSTAQPQAGYTDATVHPNAKGAMVNARRIATALTRMGTKSQGPLLSSNQFLTGSIAATGTNVSGTCPTACTLTGTVSGVYVSTANNPGWTVVASTPVGGAHLDIGTFDAGSMAIAGPLISAYAKVQIVSGAANLRSLELEPRLQDGTGNTFRFHQFMTSGDVDVDYLDGDVLTFVSPPMAPQSGAFSFGRNFIRPRMKNTTSSTTLKVLETGFYTP